MNISLFAYFCLFLFIFAIITLVISIKKKVLYINISSIVILIIITLLSFSTILVEVFGYGIILFIWLISFIILLFTMFISIKNKKNYILNYLLLFSIIGFFIGELYYKSLNDYLKNEMLYIAKKIDNLYENNDNDLNVYKIKELLEVSKNNKIDISDNEISIFGYSNKTKKKLINIKIYIIDSRNYIMLGLLQTQGIPYTEYNSREKIIYKNSRENGYFFFK